MPATRPPGVFERLALLVLGLYLTGGGIVTLTSGHTAHLNYFSAPTSAAVAMSVGLLLLVLATVGWERLSRYL